MGMSVDFHVYDIQKLKDAIAKKVTVKEGQLTPSEFLDKAMPRAGLIHENIFVVQSCDYWNEWDPYTSLQRAIESYYFVDDLYNIFNSAQLGWKYEGADETEIFDAVGITEYPAHPDDEEENEDE